MAHKKKKTSHILISLVISIIALSIGFIAAEKITFQTLVPQLFWPLCRVMIMISLGLVVGEVIEASGWTRRLGILARPAFRFANLGDHCGAAFTTAFFSGTAANAMLAGFFQDRKICKKQLILANLLNHFPAYFLHLPTTVFIVIPLTGKAGVLYFLLTFSALLLRCSGFLLYGHFRPADSYCNPERNDTVPESIRNEPFNPLSARIREKLPSRILGITIYVVPIYIAVFVLNSLGLFAFMRNWMAGFVVDAFVPVESLSLVIISFVAEFTSGFAAAGALMDAGVLTVKQTTLALLIGNILAFPIRALRHQLPRYMGIFSPRTGLELLTLGQGFRVLSLIAVGAAFFLI
jgi:hypothetical protein